MEDGKCNCITNTAKITKSEKMKRFRRMRLKQTIVDVCFLLVIIAMGVSLINTNKQIKAKEVISTHTQSKATTEENRALQDEEKVTEEMAKAESNTIGDFYFNVPLESSVQNYIFELCEKEGIELTLIFAMIQNESNFNANIISRTNDYGLMQINKINHQWLSETYNITDFLDPYQNILCGVKIISKYVHKYDGDLNRALMAYNLGETGAKRAWQNGIYSTAYSQRILEYKKHYDEELDRYKDMINFVTQSV